jgi:uncharacterized protein (TIGR03067 family)
MKVFTLPAALAAGLLFSAGLLAVPDRPPKKNKADPLAEEARKLQGTWEFAAFEYRGRHYDAAEFKVKLGNPKLIITKDKLTGTFQNQTETIPLKIDPKANPKGIELTGQRFAPRGIVPAIYELEGDTLKTCFYRGRKKRPTGFKTDPLAFIMIWKRAKP